jgi:hypothetical protein
MLMAIIIIIDVLLNDRKCSKGSDRHGTNVCSNLARGAAHSLQVRNALATKIGWNFDRTAAGMSRGCDNRAGIMPHRFGAT